MAQPTRPQVNVPIPPVSDRLNTDAPPAIVRSELAKTQRQLAEVAKALNALGEDVRLINEESVANTATGGGSGDGLVLALAVAMEVVTL